MGPRHGATNHMSGCRAAFAELNPAVCGTVRFGDDSVARIEGCGTVVFMCKNGEHRSFFGVYYIPRLTTKAWGSSTRSTTTSTSSPA